MCKEYLGKEGVVHVTVDQWQYGLVSRVKTGVESVRKATGFKTSSLHLAMQFQKGMP